ncbi:substrate-binding domain-containing protein [Lacipirellula sp.]|uniref:substrate-binding domain-containing protein n=1 Tax=Lacipirellula sp. TaxID=2691419 RepID=UPI003D0B3305
MTAGRSGLLLAGLIAVAIVFGYRANVYQQPTPKPMKSIVLVTGGSGPFWQLVEQGAKKASKDLDVDVIFKAPEDEENAEEQTDILSQLNLEDVDGVAVSPLDPETQSPLINRMCEHALVITYDSDAPLSARDTYVGASNLAAGKLVAQLVREAAPSGGEVACVAVNFTKDNMKERREGFESGLAKPTNDGDSEESEEKQPTYEIVEFLTDDSDNDRCRELAAKLLDDHPNLVCFVGMNAQHAGILLDVLKEKNLLDQVKVVGFDEASDTLDGIRGGEVYATVVQDPFRYGYESIRRIATICRGEEGLRPLSGTHSTYNIGVQAVRKDNVDAFQKQLDERLKNGKDKEAKEAGG